MCVWRRFEDFLEAIVRLAHRKALPTTQEILEAGCSSCPDFLKRLKENQHRWREFHEKHKQPWFSPLRQPMSSAITHLLELMSEPGPTPDACPHRALG